MYDFSHAYNALDKYLVLTTVINSLIHVIFNLLLFSLYCQIAVNARSFKCLVILFLDHFFEISIHSP